MAYNVSHTLKANIQAIRVALKWKSTGELNAEDIVILQAYSGFGGIKAILNPYAGKEEWEETGVSKEDLKLHEDIIRLHDLLKAHYSDQQYKEIIASLKNSVLTAFYTPQFLPETLYKAMSDQNIHPKRIYDPSAGSGVFISEAIKAFPGIEQITAVEKDQLSGLILSAINSTNKVKTVTHISAFEDAPTNDNGSYDLVVSNIPFGNFTVHDRAFPDKSISGKIHNYFFAKGLDKLAEGGLLAYITTSAFLHNHSNQEARRYLFTHADFVNVLVMPDNLMKDTGGTEAPSHLLIVQKNSAKHTISLYEEWLIRNHERENEYGRYPYNFFISTLEHDVITGNILKPGTNQYGQPTQVVWQDGDIRSIAKQVSIQLNLRRADSFNHQAFQKSLSTLPLISNSVRKKFTYLAEPVAKSAASSAQLGLFDFAPAEQTNRAMAYIALPDESIIRKESARIISTIRTTDNPGHETIVLLAAKHQNSNRFLYKLYTNVAELKGLSNWVDGRSIGSSLKLV